MKASEARKLIGQRVQWDDKTRTTALGYLRVDARGGWGILEAVKGRNVVIGGDYKWLPDLLNFRAMPPPTTPTRYESKTQPGLFYWAEANGGGAGASESYAVVSQVEGFPATEAHDDWFGRFEDADAIARAMADGTFEA